TRGEVTILIDRRHTVARRQLDDQLPMDHKENVRQIDQTTVWLTCDSGNDTLDLRNVMNAGRAHLHRERWRSSLHQTQEIRSATGGRHRVKHDGDTRDTGRDLLEELQPLSS